jgi:phosphoribosylformylglycinamidine synthase
VAVLREQGVNSHVEMAYAFTAAGFDAVDVHMSDLLAGRARLADFQGLVACGGFSYGDTLGAGIGWARSITFHRRWPTSSARSSGAATPSALGVCNGCQMFAELADIIPGAEHWPRFTTNQQRALRGPAGDGRGAGLAPRCSWPAWPAAGCRSRSRTARVSRTSAIVAMPAAGAARRCASPTTTARPTEAYPFNPNGSPGGLTAVTTPTAASPR